MSWNPFSRLTTAKKSVISRAAEREFEKEVKKLEDLDEVTRRLYKDGKRLIEANAALTKTERRLTQDLLNTTLCQTEEELRWIVEEWDHALVTLDLHSQDVNSVLHKTLMEPVKKFNSIFPSVFAAVKKREQILQEVQKCQSKVTRYQERERTGPNLVKYDAAKKAFQQIESEFLSQNSMLSDEMPQLYKGRIEYFKPTLEALIKAQVQYTTDALKVYGELSNTMNGNHDNDYATRIQQSLTELRSLSITVD